MAVFQDCMSCLESFHMLHRMVLPPELFLTHCENRSRLMLDPMRVHQNILKIHNGGADLKQLVNAVAIEFSLVNPSWRQKMLDANDQLIARSHCN